MFICSLHGVAVTYPNSPKTVLDFIDAAFIEGLQWLVSQTELFTSITRSSIGSFIFLILKWLLITSVVGFILLQSEIISSQLGISVIDLMIDIMLVITLVVLSLDYTIKKKVFLETSNDLGNTLPKEIYSRVNHRKYILIFFLPSILMAAFFKVVMEHGHLSFFSLFILVTIIVYLNFCITIEYLLCTRSLPPGEKRRA